MTNEKSDDVMFGRAPQGGPVDVYNTPDPAPNHNTRAAFPPLGHNDPRLTNDGHGPTKYSSRVIPHNLPVLDSAGRPRRPGV